ncbi:MAG: hypothetical protein AAF170_08435 [Bacteroidota bacterium]
MPQSTHDHDSEDAIRQRVDLMLNIIQPPGPRRPFVRAYLFAGVHAAFGAAAPEWLEAELKSEGLFLSADTAYEQVEA